MAALINARDKALQTARYRSGATQVTITATAGAFIKPKNGAAITPVSIKIKATPNYVFTAAATYSWQYAFSTAPDIYTTLTDGGTPVTTNEITLTGTTIAGLIGSASEIYYKCTVTEPKLDTASAVYKIIYSKESDDPITVNMTKTNVSIPCDQYGTPSSLAGTGTTITVSRGSTTLGYNKLGGALANTFTVTTNADANRTLGGTANSTTTSYVLDDLTAIEQTIDQTSTIFTVTVYDGNAVATNTFSRTLAYTKVKNGVVGADARRYYLQLNTVVLAKSSSAAAITGVHTPSSIIATGKVVAGSGLPQDYGFVTITNNAGTESGTSQVSRTHTVSNNDTATSYTVKLYDTATKTNLLDTQTVTVVYTGVSGTSGTSALSLILTNDNVSVPTDSAGDNANYTGTGTDILVYEGSTQLTYSAAANTPGTWKIDSVNASNITAGSYTTKTLQLTATAFTLASASGIATLTYSNQGSAPFATGQTITLSGFSPAQTSGTVNTVNSTFIVSTCNATRVTFALTGTYTVGTLGTVTGSVNTTLVAAAPSAITANVASITYTITGRTAADTAFTITKTQSLKKLKAGSVGVEGKRSIVVNAYKWLLSAVTAPDQAFTYNWASGVISAAPGAPGNGYPTGWTSAAPAAPGNGYTLYQLNLTLTDSPTNTTTNANWSTSTQNIIGFRQDGTIGELSAFTRIAYITLTTATPPSTPVATTGATSLPAAVGGVSWTSASPGVVPDGNYVYISTGIYGATSNQIVWAAPYLSYFKVGSLSAISASLGVVGVSTTGNIHSGTGVSDSKAYGDNKAGFFLGYDGGGAGGAGGAYKMDVGSSTSYLRFDGTTVSATGINIYTADSQDILTLAGGQEWTIAANNTVTLYSALSLKKTGITNSYDAWAYGRQFYARGAAVSFQAKEAVNREFQVGLKDSVTPGQDTTIDYGILLTRTGTVAACVNSANQSTIANSYALTDQFLVAYDNKSVYYYINGVLKYTHTTGVVAGKSFVPKIAFFSAGAYATAVKFQPWGGVGEQGPPGAASTVPGPPGPQGNTGDAGPVGQRAASQFFGAVSYPGWDSTAQAAANDWFERNFTGNSASRGKVIGDRATIFSSLTGKSETRNWDGSAWVAVNAYIDGNLLVSGSITSDALAGNIVTVGQRIVSSDGLFVIDLANKTISISV
jgi:hypothetical protein